MSTRLILAFACLLVFTPTAEGMTFEYAQMVGATYWAKRGVVIPCHPRAELLSWKETRPWLMAGGYAPDMLADVAACTVDITPWADSWRKTNDPELRADYCEDVVHEVGHLAGLEHPDQPGISDSMRKLVTGTVMGEDAPYPFGCLHPGRFLRHRARAVARSRAPRPRACDSSRLRCPTSP